MREKQPRLVRFTQYVWTSLKNVCVIAGRALQQPDFEVAAQLLHLAYTKSTEYLISQLSKIVSILDRLGPNL